MSKMGDIQVIKDLMEIENKRYHRSGDYSSTELIDPPRLVCMKQRYGEQLYDTIETKVDSLMGTAMHGLFESNLNELGDARYRLEEEVSMQFICDGSEEPSGDVGSLPPRRMADAVRRRQDLRQHPQEQPGRPHPDRQRGPRRPVGLAPAELPGDGLQD